MSPSAMSLHPFVESLPKEVKDFAYQVWEGAAGDENMKVLEGWFHRQMVEKYPTLTKDDTDKLMSYVAFTSLW